MYISNVVNWFEFVICLVSAAVHVTMYCFVTQMRIYKFADIVVASYYTEWLIIHTCYTHMHMVHVKL